MTISREHTVDWADVDLFGHMNNVAYFRYVQSARVNFCRESGLAVLNEPGELSFTIAETSCRFMSALKFGETFKVVTTLQSHGTTSFTLRHVFYRDHEESAAATDVLVCFNHHTGQKHPIPAATLEKWKAMGYGR